MRNDWTDYLMHRNHKYVAKIGDGPKARYIYTNEELRAYYNQARGAKKKMKLPSSVDIATTKKTKKSKASELKELKKKSKKNKAKIKALKEKKKLAKKKKIEKMKKRGAVNSMGLSKKEVKAALDIWNKGKYGNGAKRVKNLKKAGLNPKRVQKYLNAASKVGWNFKKLDKKIAFKSSKTGTKVSKGSTTSKGSKTTVTKRRIKSGSSKRSTKSSRARKKNATEVRNVVGREKVFEKNASPSKIKSNISKRTVKKSAIKSSNTKSTSTKKKKKKKTKKAAINKGTIRRSTLNKRAESGVATVSKILSRR